MHACMHHIKVFQDSLLEALALELVFHSLAPLGVPKGLTDLLHGGDQPLLVLIGTRLVVQALGQTQLWRSVLQLTCTVIG